MYNGYGYQNAVSPASTAGYPGYNHGYGNPQAQALAAMTQQQMQMQMPASQMPSGHMMQMPAMQTAGAQSQTPPSVPNGSIVTQSGGNVVGMPMVEESYVENILRMNRGKMATFYMTYENNREWNAKIFHGVIEAAGRDHIIISDPSTGMRYLLLTLNLDYVTFDGPINYSYTFQGQTITNTTPQTPTASTTGGTTGTTGLGR